MSSNNFIDLGEIKKSDSKKNSENDVKELELEYKNYHKNKYMRYLIFHKGKFSFMVLTILIILLCMIFNVPINGDPIHTSTIKHALAMFGYLASNIFLGLIISILSVETLKSRKEYDNLNKNIEKKLLKKIKKINNPILIKKSLKSIIYNKKKSTVIIGNNEKIIEDLEEIMLLNPKDKLNLYKELSKY